MKRPTAEEFAQAPLFRPYIFEAPEPVVDYSAEKLIVEGFELVRTDIDGGGFRFSLEGVDIVDVMPTVGADTAVWVGTFFDGNEHRVPETDKRLATVEFATFIHDLVINQADAIVFHMESNGIDIVHGVADDIDYQTAADELDDEDEDDLDAGEVAPARERFGEQVRIVRKGFHAWIEGQETARTWGEVRAEFARASEDGTPLCPASLPILQQLEAIERFLEGTLRHREDLKSLRQLVGNPEDIADQGLRMGVHMFDMVDSDLKDPKVPQAAIAAHREAMYLAIVGEEGAPQAQVVAVIDPTAPAAPRQAERPLEDAMKEATGFAVGHFTELRSMPGYQREQIRATVRPLFEDIFGEDFPMERVVVGRPGRDPEAYAAFMYFFRDGELVKDIGPITFPHMPGYRTSHAEVRRRDGWDTLVFSDPFGTYAYGVPSPSLTNDADIDGPVERTDNDSGASPAP